MDLVLTNYCCLLKDMHHFYKENKLSVLPLCHFELDPSSFFSLDSCFWTMYKESSVVSGK